eukprot:9892984-Lingulodinium_polyedra.AAC.1
MYWSVAWWWRMVPTGANKLRWHLAKSSQDPVELPALSKDIAPTMAWELCAVKPGQSLLPTKDITSTVGLWPRSWKTELGNVFGWLASACGGGATCTLSCKPTTSRDLRTSHCLAMDTLLLDTSQTSASLRTLFPSSTTL